MFCPCVPSHVSGIRTLKTSFSLCERRGRGDEGQKARECRKPHHHAGPGVASIASSWLSSPPVAPDAGWKPAHPGSGEQPAGCAGCGLEARAPWQFRQDAAGIESRPKFISVAVWGHDSGSVQPYLIDSTSMGIAIDARWLQIRHKNVLRASLPQQENVGLFQHRCQRVDKAHSAEHRKKASKSK